MTKQEEVISQQVLIDDWLITELRDREYAESLAREVGVRLYANVPYWKMPYCKHYKWEHPSGEMWEFSNRPFKGGING